MSPTVGLQVGSLYSRPRLQGNTRLAIMCKVGTFVFARPRRGGPPGTDPPDALVVPP